MTQALILPAAGLMTDPGPFTAAPDGGMLEAQNVVILRPGVLEPRPRWVAVVDETVKAASDAIQVFSDVNSVQWVWCINGLMRKNSATTITGPSSFERGKTWVVNTGGRALFTTGNGVCTLPAQQASPSLGDATIAYRAGMPQPYAPIASAIASTVASALPNDSALAYRVTLRRRLADGTIVESAPSGRMVVRNQALGASSVQLSNIPGAATAIRSWVTPVIGSNAYGDIMPGDELCIYRSALATPYTATPSDEMRLRAVLTAQASPTYFGSFVDALPDASWTGASLYTNATQEGALLGNFRPQYARDIALYKGMTFYAGAMTAQRLTLNLKSVGGSSNKSQTLNSVNITTGNILIATNTITTLTLADMADMAVGQVITRDSGTPGSADAYFPSGTYITALNTGTLTATVSANALATQAGASLVVWDWIEVTFDATTKRIYAANDAFPAPPSAAFYTQDDISAYATYRIAGAQDLDNAWQTLVSGSQSVQLRVTESVSQYQVHQDLTLVFERQDPVDASFVVKSSKPLAFDRYVDYSTGITSAQAGGIAELHWSKVNEPEHCPLPYRAVIGNASSAIRRIVEARQSLLVFKDDGLFQVFGDTPTSLRIEMLDSTVRLPVPLSFDEQCKWVAKFDDRVFAITTRGPLMLTDSGATPCGAPILESLRRRFVNAFGAYDTALRATMVDPQTRRVGFFFTTAENSSTGPSSAYVLDVDAGTWVYWTFRRDVAACATQTDLGEPLMAGTYMSGGLFGQRIVLDDPTFTISSMPTSDTVNTVAGPSSECTITAVTGTGPYSVTIASGSEWTPTVGDILVRSGVAYSVSAVADTEHFTTLTQPSTGTATWKEGYDCRCIWVARVEGNVGAEKHWRSVVFPFELAALTVRMKSYFKGYRNTAAATEAFIDTSQSIGTSPWTLAPTFKRVAVPTVCGRDWALKVGFTSQCANQWFSTAGVSVLFEGVAPDLAAGRT